MSYVQSSSQSQVNLVEKVLEQGQKLRNSMVKSILNMDPFYQDNIGMPVRMHTINMDIEKKELSTAEKHKFVAYLSGESMSKDDEKQALQTFRAMSNDDICEITESSYNNLRSYCSCDSCVEYHKVENNIVPRLKINIIPKTTAKKEINDSLIQYLKYIDSLKISVHSLKLNHVGDVKVSSSHIDSRYSHHLSTTYFIEYNIPSCFLKNEIKKSKVDTGLTSSNNVKLCSKKLHKEAIYFKQISIHDVSNLESVNLEDIDLIFQVSSRTAKQKTLNILGQARFNMASFLSTKYFSCNQELVVWLVNDAPIALGTIKINLQLGCGRIYFGKEFLDSICLDKSNNILPEIIPCNQKQVIKENICDSTLQNIDIGNESAKRDLNAPIMKKKVEIKTVKKPEVISKPSIANDIVLFGFVYIAQVEYLDIKQATYFTCKPFCQDDSIYSNLIRGGSNPVFNYYQTIPFIYNEDLLAKLRDNFMIIEFFERNDNKDSSIGVCKVPLHQYYLAFRNTTIVKYLERNKLPVIGTDWFEPISNPTTGSIVGQVQILVALGSEAQIHNLENERGFKDNIVTKAKKSLRSVRPPRSDFKEINLKFNDQTNHLYKTVNDEQTLDSGGSDVFSSYRNHYWRPCRKFNIEKTDEAKSESRLDELRFMFKQLEEVKKNEEQNIILVKEKQNLDTSISLKQSDCSEIIEEVSPKKYINNTHQIIESTLQTKNSTVIQQKVDKSTYTVELIDKSSQADIMDLQKDMLESLLQQLITQRTRNMQSSCADTENISDVKTVQNVRKTTDLLDSLQKVLVDETPKNTLKAQVLVDSALHLPTRKKCKPKKVKAKVVREEILPSTYVTFETSDDMKITQVVQKSSNPLWNFKCDVNLSLDFLTNNQKRLIFKVWKKSNNASMEPNMEIDSVLGFAALDLTVLSAGLPTVEGWFNIVDFSSKCNGQIKIHISPLESIRKQTHEESSTVESSPNISLPKIQEESGEVFSRALKRKFTELDEITQRLRSRLSNVTNDESDTSNDDVADEFEKDINTLCVEEDYDMIDFEREAQDLNMQRVSNSLLKLQGALPNANQTLMLYEDSNNSTPNDSLQFGSPSNSDCASIGSLDKHLAEGKQRIDSLLQKLSLQEFGARHVSGCSIQGSKLDSSQSEDEILREIGIDKQLDVTKLLNEKVLEALIDERQRDAPDGEGNMCEIDQV